MRAARGRALSRIGEVFGIPRLRFERDSRYRRRVRLMTMTWPPRTLGTPAAIEAFAMSLSIAVRSALIVTTGPGRFTVLLQMAWWSWLAFGLLHRRVRRLMRATEGAWKPAGTVAEVDW